MSPIFDLKSATYQVGGETVFDAAWDEEIDRRVADIESGVVQLIPIADALTQVRAVLK